MLDIPQLALADILTTRQKRRKNILRAGSEDRAIEDVHNLSSTHLKSRVRILRLCAVMWLYKRTDPRYNELYCLGWGARGSVIG
jgi:hypothetical protein